MASFATGPLTTLIDAFWSHCDMPCPKDGGGVQAFFHVQLAGYALRHQGAGHALFRSPAGDVPPLDAS